MYFFGTDWLWDGVGQKSQSTHHYQILMSLGLLHLENGASRKRELDAHIWAWNWGCHRERTMTGDLCVVVSRCRTVPRSSMNTRVLSAVFLWASSRLWSLPWSLPYFYSWLSAKFHFADLIFQWYYEILVILLVNGILFIFIIHIYASITNAYHFHKYFSFPFRTTRTSRLDGT